MDVRLDNISFSYGNTPILHNVDLTAQKGKVIGILGENGCGKTTLLKCINNLLSPKAGGAFISDIPDGALDEKTLSKVEGGSIEVKELNNKELARCMAVVSQSAYISFPFNVLDAVMMGRYARSGMSGRSEETDKDAVFSALNEAGAFEFIERHVNELSGGELRRVMIARALAQDPEVLLLDEPTLHLDVSHQFDLMELITKLAREKKILVIIVTHDMVLAARYCDDLILMSNGSVVASGTTKEIMTEENMEMVFHIKTDIRYDDRIDALSVTLLGKTNKSEV